ncbi:MAG TPA: phosphatase PAP2 family protein [Candidatus Limnocylindria bacterium]|jgi:undecaprenyl-diphosphatase|nr:phosphatase PAP2 family protein [Candidatus Limnocylindria bacterium]
MLAAATLLPLLLLAVWARIASPAVWEAPVLGALALAQGGWLDLLRLLNTAGDLPVWAAIVATLAIAVGRLRGLVAGLLVGMTIAADLAAAVIKLLVERSRPEAALVEHFFGGESFAFPSGHVVRAVALVAVLVWLLAPVSIHFRLAVVGAILAGVVMGYARVAVGVHWPTDALGGTLLGLGWFALSVRLAAPALDSATPLEAAAHGSRSRTEAAGGQTGEDVGPEP